MNNVPSLSVDVDEDAETRIYRPERDDSQVKKALPNLAPATEVGDETKVFRPSAELMEAASGPGDLRPKDLSDEDISDKATEIHHVPKEVIYAAREARAARRNERSGVRRTSMSGELRAERSIYVTQQSASPTEAQDHAKHMLYGVWLLAIFLGIGLIGMLMIGY